MSTPPTPDPPIKPLTLLGAEMRKHRIRANITQVRLAATIQFSQSLIGFIERGERNASHNFMQRYDDAVGADGELVRLWADLTRGASPRWFRNWLDIEQEAHTLHAWEPLYMPGLLQTAEYATLVIRGEPGISDAQVEKAISTRMKRQTIFQRSNPPMFRVILDEGVLHRPIGGKSVMQRQLERLANASESSRIGIQIIPLSLGITTGLLGGFAIAQISGSSDRVYIESATNGHVSDHPEDVEAIHRRYDALRAAAHPQHVSSDLIREAEKLWT